MKIPLPSSSTIRILIIDDDEEDFLIIRQFISRINGNDHFVIEWCDNFQDGLRQLCQGQYTIYFVDFRLGPKTGLELITEAVNKNCEQPIILLTGAGNRDIDVLAMQAGAADYLVKSELTTEKLERCIRYGVARHEFLNLLRANEQKYRGIFERTRDFIFIADETLAFTETNQVGTALFGYTAEEFRQIRLFDLLANPDDLASIVPTDLGLVGELNDLQIDLRSKTNDIINCVLSLTVEKDAAGGLYLQGIIHDITALKNAEKSKLQTTRLQATERLVRVLAHEVRNPLNNIMLATETLAITTAEDDKMYIDIVTRNSNRINKLITELLTASKPAVLSLEQVSLQSVLKKSIAAALDRLVLKKVKLDQDYISREAVIMADTEKLSMAFLNIILNGIEASTEEGAHIQIKLKEERDNYVVTVSDNGNGINEENLARLFEPYFTSKAAGMGLGLSSALGIFESHRALVKVTSIVGTGTTFHVIFPTELIEKIVMEQ